MKWNWGNGAYSNDLSGYDSDDFIYDERRDGEQDEDEQ